MFTVTKSKSCHLSCYYCVYAYTGDFYLVLIVVFAGSL
jgi:hypothetical protein